MDPATLAGDDRIATARLALAREGFAAIDHVFSDEQVAEVERLLDQLLEDLRWAPRGRRSRRFARDMAPAAADGVAGAGPHPDRPDWDQPELIHAGCLRPELLATGLFRLCRAIAVSIGGPVSRSFDHAIYKPPAKRVATAWHQDSAFARLRPAGRIARLHFWIPLQDASRENGCMQFIPGSHRMPLLPHRSVPRRSGSHGRELAGFDGSGAVACPVRRGGLTIHTPHTLHCAGPNLTDAPCKAWIIQFAPFGGAQIAVKRLLGRSPGPLRA